MKFTKLTAAIREHAEVSEADAQAIAKGLMARGLIEEQRVVAPKLCECCAPTGCSPTYRCFGGWPT